MRKNGWRGNCNIIFILFKMISFTCMSCSKKTVFTTLFSLLFFSYSDLAATKSDLEAQKVSLLNDQYYFLFFFLFIFIYYCYNESQYSHVALFSAI